MAIAFAVVLTAELCFPTPQGPADTGDSYRVMIALSSGPEGLPLFVARNDPRRPERLLTYYHRYWTVAATDRRPIPSTTNLLFAATRHLAEGPRPGYLDLTLHAFLVILMTAAALALLLGALAEPVAFVSAAALVLLLTDAPIAAYVNSPYQEAGAYVCFVTLVPALLALWSHASPLRLLAVLVLAGGLMGAKPAYTPSVALAVLPMLVGWVIVRLTAGLARRRGMLILSLVVGTLVLTLLIQRRVTVTEYEPEHCFNYIFTGALPRIAEEQRGEFLRTLGLDPGLTVLAGRPTFDPTARFSDPEVHSAFGRQLHLRAIAATFLRHPVAAWQLVLDSLAMAGRYDIPWLGYRERVFNVEPQRPGGLVRWSRLRLGVLRGARAYVVGVALLTLLSCWTAADPAPDHRADDWSVCLSLLGIGFLAASFSQVVVAVLGDGTTDLWKHQYLANVLLDATLVLASAGIVRRVCSWPRLRVRCGSTRRCSSPPRPRVGTTACPGPAVGSGRSSSFSTSGPRRGVNANRPHDASQIRALPGGDGKHHRGILCSSWRSD